MFNNGLQLEYQERKDDMSKRKQNTRIAYGISLYDNDYYETNLEDELLLFDTYEQIGEYASVNDIDFEAITVHEFEVEEFAGDINDIPEIGE